MIKPNKKFFYSSTLFFGQSFSRSKISDILYNLRDKPAFYSLQEGRFREYIDGFCRIQKLLGENHDSQSPNG